MPDQLISELRLRASRPALPPALVRRRRLEQRFSGGIPWSVVLVSAGPGSGKTTAVASWLHGSADAASWLTLDEADNDLRTFWVDVLGALSAGDVLPAGSRLQDFVPAATFGAPEALLVRTGLAELPEPVMLVLDDVQHLRNAEVLDSLSTLIEHRPPQLRLVLVTRADPALRLHRLRAAGGLTEIRSEELAFTEDEAAELFALDGIHLTEDQLRVLLERTLGWPVGLRLAAMSLAATDVTRGIARFTGTERSVAEYLIGEVLDRLPAADRDFLLRTSIAERISPSLATALTGRRDSQGVLEGMVAGNSFVVGLGDGSGWFRYHPLLRELMQHRLSLEQPGATEELHTLAARWFAAGGRPIQAIRHATIAGDWDEVGRLLVRSAAPLILTADAPALAAALEPAARRAAGQPRLSTLLAAAIWHFQRQDFPAMHRDTTEAAEFLPEAPDDVRVPAELLIAATTVAHDRLTASAALVGSSTRLLSLLDGAPRRLVPAAPHHRVVGLNNLGVGQLWAGDLPAAQANLDAAEARARELGMGLSVVTAVAHLAVLDVIHGRLHRARRRASAARDLVDRRGWAAEPQTLGLYVALGMTLLAESRLEEAADVIGLGLAASSRGSDTGCRLALGIAAVGVAVARGDAAAARSAADRLRTELAEVVNPPDLLARWCRVAQAPTQLLAGDPDKPVRLLDPVEDDGFVGAVERVALGRAHLALGHPDRLSSVLGPLTRPDVTYLGPSVEARVLLALAADRRHRDTAALELLTDAIDLAEPEGLIRPFLDAGPAAGRLITRHRHVVARHLDFTRQLLTRAPGPAGHPAAPVGAMGGEHLTERELIVLRYLPTMLKAAEIAEDLYVSVNTVKAHLRSIYRKLDAATRREAVERARGLSLL